MTKNIIIFHLSLTIRLNLSNLCFCFIKKNLKAHGGGRVVSASGSETSVSSLTPTSAIIYDAYTSIIKKKEPERSATVRCKGKNGFQKI